MAMRVWGSGMKKAIPVMRRKNAIKGKVVRSKNRRPKVSIVQMAGAEKTKLSVPNPSEATNA